MKRPHAPAAGADLISSRSRRRQRGRVLAGKEKQEKRGLHTARSLCARPRLINQRRWRGRSSR